MPDPTQHRHAFRLEVNAPIAIRFDEHAGRQLNVILLDLSEGGCRFRCGVSIPAKTLISMDWVGPSRKPFHLVRRVVGVQMADAKTAEYHLQFEMPTADRDHFATELLEVQRRAVFKPIEAARTQVPVDTSIGGRAKRQAYRCPVQFPVTVRLTKDGRQVQFGAEANDLSSGGILLGLSQEFEEGTEVELHFTLPLGAVDLGGEEHEVTEQTPFGPRKVKKALPVRAFEPIQTKARILKRVGTSPNGKLLHGTGFVDLAPFIAEEIARFSHAYQRAQLRKSAATQG
jgi:c-di-GMP-binding flagellar brake protein YcgR